MNLNFIFAMLAALCLVIGVLMFVFNTRAVVRHHQRMEYEYGPGSKEANTPKPMNKSHLIPIACALVLFIVSSAFRIIPTGYTGVRTTFGLIDQESCQAGLNLTVPFIQKVNLVNNKQQDIRIDEQIWSETKEQTPVYMQGVTVSYQIVPESSAWIYANVDNWVEELVDADIISSALKAASRKMGADDVTNRNEIEPMSRDRLQSAIDDKYGENRVVIKNVIINNMDFDESYNAAIAKKSEALQKQREQEITNQTNIDIANADAEAEIARAEGRAQALLIEAQAKADANKIITASITPATQRQDAIDKWNGVLPKATGDDISFGIMDVAGSAAAGNSN